jgi:CBS domain-containing protein
MKVSDVMSKGVRTCTANASLAEAAKTMWDKDCGFVPVTDAVGRLSGVLTDRDACMAALTRGKPLGEIEVSSAMTRAPATCGPNDDVAKAAETMGRLQVRRLPVVDSAQRVVGVVSLNDLAIQALESPQDVNLSTVATALGRISKHR